MCCVPIELTSKKVIDSDFKCHCSILQTYTVLHVCVVTNGTSCCPISVSGGPLVLRLCVTRLLYIHGVVLRLFSVAQANCCDNYTLNRFLVLCGVSCKLNLIVARLVLSVN